jgi:hypothetical protein
MRGKKTAELRRFPLSLDLRFRVLGHSRGHAGGVGKTVSITRVGVLFTGAGDLSPGVSLKLLICWPYKLDGERPLHLVIWGRVVSSVMGQTLIMIRKHRLCTEGADHV